ncbi:MAG: DNA primase [Pseudomonadota bacterium]
MNAPTIRIPDGFVDEMKARLRPSDIIGRKVKLKKQGKEWVGLSPFTNEKTPSFYVNDQKKIFKCFSSGLGGDVISFVMETERLSFMEAIEKLAEEAGMSLPKATPQDQEAYNRRERLYAACEAAAAYFEDQLRGAVGAQARTYLEGRGLLSASWGKYRLGYAPDGWQTLLDVLQERGFTMDELQGAGLASVKEGRNPISFFRNRLMFPIEDIRGRVMAFGARALGADDKPKYLNTGDTDLFDKSRSLYRYKRAREAFGDSEAEGLIVCEGYMDVIALAEAGIGYGVAPLGTALTIPQLDLLWRAGPEPVVCFDGDAAGQRAMNKAIENALPGVEPGRSLFFCELPEGMDPDDFLKQHSAREMHHRLENAEALVTRLWRRERDLEPLDTPERQAGLEARLMMTVSVINNPTVKSAYQRDLKGRMRDHFWSLRSAARGQDGAAFKSQLNKLKSGSLSKTTGLGHLARAVDNPHLAELGYEALALAQFKSDDVAAIRDAVLSLIDAELPIDRAAIYTHLRNSENLRAADLLNTYPDMPSMPQGGAEEREWLIALEQYARHDGAGSVAGNLGDAFATPEDAKLRHRLVSERRARATRLSDAAEKADQG